MRVYSRKLIPFLIILAFASMFPSAVGAESWKMTLEEALERAMTENRDIETAKQRLIELQGLIGEARSAGLPQLTGTTAYTRLWKKPLLNINDQTFRVGSKNDYTAGANVDQLLWNGGKVFKAVRAAKLEELRGINNIKDAEALVRLDVKETFYEILYTDKMIDVLYRQLRELKAHLGSIRTRYNQGLESDYTLMRQEVQVSNIEPQIIDAKRNRELLLNALKILLAIPPEDVFTPVGTFAYHFRQLPSVESLIDTAKGDRPDLEAEKQHTRALAQVVGIEKAGYFPSINFSTTFQWEAQTDDFVVGHREHTNSLRSAVNLSWPIFDGLKTPSRVKQAESQLMQQHIKTTQLEDNVVKEVIDTYQTLLKTRQSLSSQQKSLALAKRATKIASERFESGLMSQLELNDTIDAQALAEQNYLRALYDCLTTEASLEKVTGGAL